MGEAVVASEESGVFAPVTEEMATGQEVTLGAGDAALFPPNASGEIRNDGNDPTSVLVVLVGPPVLMGQAEGTPTS